MNDIRYLAIMADGVIVADENRIHIRGRSTMTLEPDTYEVQVYNMSPAALAAVRSAEQVSVIGKRGSVLCSCKPADIIHTAKGAQKITTLYMVEGEAFWKSSVSVTIRGGSDYLTALRAILSHSTHITPLASAPPTHHKTIRSMSVYGRTADYVHQIAMTMGCRAYNFRDTINLARLGEGTAETVITDDDLLEPPAQGNGVASYCTDLVSIMVGRRVTINSDTTGGIWRLVAQQIDADNQSGSWRSDLIMINENEVTYGWEGGL